MLPSRICMFVAGTEPLLTIKIFALRDQVGMQAHILKALRGNILTTVLENIEIIVIEGKITFAALMENLLDKPTCARCWLAGIIAQNQRIFLFVP